MWRLCRGFIFVTGIVFIATEALIGVAQVIPHDFLAAYRTLMPGQPIDGVAAFPCQLHTGVSNGVEVGSCQFEAGDGMFGRVTVIEADHIITRLAFSIEPEVLHLGDLIVCWGEPTQLESAAAVVEGSHPMTRWDNRVYVGHAFFPRGARKNYFLTLNYLSLENAPLPCASGD